MRLSLTSYDWALNHLLEQGDTDIFPKAFEFECIKECWPKVRAVLENLEIEKYIWHSSRRFVVPKEETAFRIGTQLSPLDNIVLTAIVKEVGEKIEQNRFPSSANRAFSYRFMPTPDGEFFARHMVWNEFWRESKNKSTKFNWVIVSDVSDLYNQISHHSVENELMASGIQKEAVKSILSLLSMVTGTVSRGIPVGSHAVHMLSECTLNEIDRSLASRGYDFCRYVDDIHIFVDTREQAVNALFNLAEILDKQQRLVMNKQKTKILSSEHFAELADDMLTDRPINADEEEILQMINKYSRGDNYKQVRSSKLSLEDRAKITDEKVISVLRSYLHASTIDNTRLGWFIRRLAQIGTSAGLEYIVRNIVEFLPCIGSVARLVISSDLSYSDDNRDLGTILLKAMENPIVAGNNYVQIIILNLFISRSDLNQIDQLTARYAGSSSSAKREIVRAASKAKRTAFIRERKDEFISADPWLRNAIVESTSCLMDDERIHWLSSLQTRLTPVEQIIAASCAKQPSLITFDENSLCHV